MKKAQVSRRVAIGVLGAGAVGAAVGVVTKGARRPAWRGARAAQPAGGAPPRQKSAKAQAARVEAPQQLAESLVAPLVPGSQLDRWRVVRVMPVENGAASVVLADAQGRNFQLDVCARDMRQGAPVSPGQSEIFQIFLANSGNGAKATFEEHGLAAMTLAEVIRGNEHRVVTTSFQTLSERIARHGAYVHLHLA
jgi:hypothetical protein